MSILHVPVTASNLAEWVRRAAGAINQLITGKQDKSDNLTSLSDLDLTGHSGDAVVVTAGEDGFELSAVSGGSGIADGDYGDVTVSSSGTVISIDAGVVSTTELGGDITTAGKAILDDSTAGDQLTTLGLSANGKSLVTAADYAAMKALLDLEIGTDVQAYDADLGALAANSTDGLWAHTGAGTGAARTITAGTGISVTNGDGKAGNPTIACTVSGSSWTLSGGAYTSAGIWDQSADGSTSAVTFTGLAGCTDILLIMDAVTKSASGTPFVRASDDNGSTWETGYAFHSTAGVRTTNSVFCEMHLTAATAARDAICLINAANGPRAVAIAVTANVSHRIFIGQTAAINAVQITPSAGGNFTGGKFYCLTR